MAVLDLKLKAFIHKRRAMPIVLAVNCLQVMSEISTKGRAAQKSVGKGCFLRRLLRIYEMSKQRQATYIAISPLLINVFLSCVSSPVNATNQRKLSGLISSLILLLTRMRGKMRLKRHIREHWLLLSALLEGNTSNVAIFLLSGGRSLIRLYERDMRVSVMVESVKSNLVKFADSKSDPGPKTRDDQKQKDCMILRSKSLLETVHTAVKLEPVAMDKQPVVVVTRLQPVNFSPRKTPSPQKKGAVGSTEQKVRAQKSLSPQKKGAVGSAEQRDRELRRQKTLTELALKVHQEQYRRAQSFVQKNIREASEKNQQGRSPKVNVLDYFARKLSWRRSQ